MLNSRQAKNLPKDVERYVDEGIEQGMSEDKAWAVAWSRYCVAGDTYVNTSMGMMTVAEVASKAVGRKIVHSDGVVAQEITVGIASHSGIGHTSFVINTGIKQVIEVTSKHGYVLKCTPDHQLLVLNTEDYSTEWLDASECGGRYLVLPTHGICGDQTKLPTLSYKQKVWNNVTPLRAPREMSRDLARVLGYLVSEGSITEEGIEFSNTDPRVVADYTRCMTTLFGEAPKIEWSEPNLTHRRVRRCAKVRSRTRWYQEFFARMGMAPCVAQEKEVPHTLLNAPKKFVVEFLRAFVEGDGYTGDKDHLNRVDLSTSSEKLAKQLHLLLANLGILGTLEQNRRGYFNVRIHSEPMVRRFVDIVGGGVFKKVALTKGRQRQRGSEFECIPAAAITGIHKSISNKFPGARRVSLSRVFRFWDLLETHAGGHPILSNLQDLKDKGYMFDLASVKNAGEVEVFDLSVPGDSSFVTNGLIAHNCKYKNPGSEHCKMNKSDYFPGRKADFSGMAARVAARHLRATDRLPNPLDGMDKAKGVRWLNSIIGKVNLRGVFRDASWRPIRTVLDTLADHGVFLSNSENFYSKDDQGRPNAKTWKFEVEWLGPKGRPVTGYGMIVASGAGSVNDPLEAYDVVAYFS